MYDLYSSRGFLSVPRAQGLVYPKRKKNVFICFLSRVLFLGYYHLRIIFGVITTAIVSTCRLHWLKTYSHHRLVRNSLIVCKGGRFTFQIQIWHKQYGKQLTALICCYTLTHRRKSLRRAYGSIYGNSAFPITNPTRFYTPRVS